MSLPRDEMNNRQVPKALLIASVTLAAFLLGQVALSANSIGPPAEIWFALDYEIAEQPALVGAQIINCTAEDCIDPVMLMQYGRCDGADCLPKPTTQGARGAWNLRFECAAGLCRFASYGWEGGYLRLVVQFSDRTRVSGLVGPVTTHYGLKKAWRVLVRESDLALEEDTTFTAPSTNYNLFGGALALTEVVELIVAAAFVSLVLRNSGRLRGVLTVIFLVNLITLPVVWYTFPSWGRFQSGTARSIGWFVLAWAVVYALLLVGLYRSEGKKRRTLLILTILSLPVAYVATFIALFVTSYGNYDIAMRGLSPVVVVMVSEAFAVGAEAWLISRMAWKTLTGRQAAAMSLLANAASFLVGLWVMGSR